MSADLAALADEALYAEQWLLQGQPVGSLTPGASKMRDIEAALRTLAAADEKMPVAACLAEESGTVSKLVRSTDAQAAVLAAVATERQRIEREVLSLIQNLSRQPVLYETEAILRAIRGEPSNSKEPT